MYQPSVPVFDHPHGEEIFPDVQSAPLLVQLCAVPTYPVISYHRAETNTSLSISLSLQ